MPARDKHSSLFQTLLKVHNIGPRAYIVGAGIYNNNYSSIIDIYFFDTFSTLTQTFSACAQLFRHPV